MRNPGVPWSLMFGLMMASLAHFLDMVWFQVYVAGRMGGEVSPTLGNGYKIQGQNYITRLQGKVL